MYIYIYIHIYISLYTYIEYIYIYIIYIYIIYMYMQTYIHIYIYIPSRCFVCFSLFVLNQMVIYTDFQFESHRIIQNTDLYQGTHPRHTVTVSKFHWLHRFFKVGQSNKCYFMLIYTFLYWYPFGSPTDPTC